MSRNIYWWTVFAVLLGNPLNALAADDTDLQAIRDQIQQLKQSDEQRIMQLEQRLQQAEANSQQAESAAAQAQAAAQQPVRSSVGPSSENSFNPAMALILSGTYGNSSKTRRSQPPASPRRPTTPFT